MLIQCPRPSQCDDPLDAFSDFHEAVRDVAAWAAWIVDDAGTASPRDARWLRAFLRGPMLWHLNDEDVFLFPRLRGRSAWLDRTLDTCLAQRAVLESAAAGLGALAELLAHGDRVPLARWRSATAQLEEAAGTCLAHEDTVILPSARLWIGEADKRALRDDLIACEQTRAWDDVSGAADAVASHPIHTVHTRTARGADFQRRFAACPRQRTVDLATCEACAHEVTIQIGDSGHDGTGPRSAGCGSVSCAIDARPVSPSSVAAIMTRDVYCVEPDTALQEAIALMASRGLSALPVLDEMGKPVGMLSQSDVVRSLAEHATAHLVKDVMMHLAFCVRETDALADAARLLVWESIHRVAVVNAEGALVGVVSALDVVRTLAGRAPAAVAPERAQGLGPRPL